MSRKDEKKTRRFYLPGLSPGRLALPVEEARHARTVLRVRPGEAVRVFDGRGAVADGRVVEVTRGEVAVEVGAVRRSEPIRPAVHLGFAVPKGKRVDRLLEKATELGAASLQPVRFSRSVATVGAGGNKARRWSRHVIEAAKQCGLDWLPELREEVGLDGWLASAGTGAMAGDLSESARPMGEVVQASVPEELYLLVGPEGGLTDDEREEIGQAGGCLVRLGRTTLRIETACVALLAGIRALREAGAEEG
jgi:16S rRNA (uracil1498-N3)-methyltransferase